uniref:Regulatory protein zeste n=1 Tax=Timema douglasi TaxID=61478 RepID=A0A7R8VUG3_TIMDO|nr:unnamed protein product [Timema douglasi]
MVPQLEPLGEGDSCSGPNSVPGSGAPSPIPGSISDIIIDEIKEEKKFVFKDPAFQHSSKSTNKKRAWRSLKQIVAQERVLPWPEDAVHLTTLLVKLTNLIINAKIFLKMVEKHKQAPFNEGEEIYVLEQIKTHTIMESKKPGVGSLAAKKRDWEEITRSLNSTGNYQKEWHRLDVQQAQEQHHLDIQQAKALHRLQGATAFQDGVQFRDESRNPPGGKNSSIDALPSFKPAKKYSDISGLLAKYTDPQTKLHFAVAEEFGTVRSLPMDITAGYLSLRRANNPMG